MRDDIVLFLPTYDATVKEMLPPACMIRDEFGCPPVFALTRKDKISDAVVEELVGGGFKIIDLTGTPIDQRPPGRFTALCAKILDRIAPTGVRAFAKFYTTYKHQLRTAARVLEEDKVTALATVGDRTLGWETAFIKAARAGGLPRVVVPFALARPYGGALIYRTKKKDFNENYVARGAMASIALRLWPGWALEYKGEKILFHPLPQALAAQFAGMMPAQPWLLGGGHSSQLLAESGFMRDTLIQSGLDRDKIVVTGKPSMDMVAAQIHTRSRRSDGRHTIIVFAIPPHAERGVLGWPEHLTMIEQMLRDLDRLVDVRIVASLHPRSAPASYKPLLARYHVAIAEESIQDLLLGCDLYVSGTSSTVMFALALKIPTVCLSYHTGGQKLMPESELLEPVWSLDQFETALHTALKKCRSGAAADHDDRYWAILDGGCTRRIVERLLNRETRHAH